MAPYIAVLYQIVAAGQKTNSYKFALWRALAQLAPGSEESSQISKRDLSPLFLEYYWPLEAKYHIRQGIDPDKDPIVMKRIRQLMEAGTITHGEALTDFRRRRPTEHTKLQAEARKVVNARRATRCDWKPWSEGLRGGAQSTSWF